MTSARLMINSQRYMHNIIYKGSVCTYMRDLWLFVYIFILILRSKLLAEWVAGHFAFLIPFYCDKMEHR